MQLIYRYLEFVFVMILQASEETQITILVSKCYYRVKQCCKKKNIRTHTVTRIWCWCGGSLPLLLFYFSNENWARVFCISEHATKKSKKFQNQFFLIEDFLVVFFGCCYYHCTCHTLLLIPQKTKKSKEDEE